MKIVPYSHLRHLPPTLRLPLLLQHYRQLPLSLPLRLHLLARSRCHPLLLLLNRRLPLHRQRCHQLPLSLPLQLNRL